MSGFVKLGDLTHIRTGKLDANASSENGQYPFFTCSKEPLRIASYSYDCECVLVAGNGDLNVKYYDGKFDAYQRTYIIESADKRKLLVKYLYFFLDIYVEVLRTQSIGGVIKYIKLSNLTDALIPLPSIKRQAEIIECLEKCNTLIDKRQREIALIEQTVKSRFIELFGDCDLTHPQESWVTIKEIGSVVGGATPKTDHDEYWGGSYRWITPAELDADSGYIYDSVRKLTKAGVESCSLQEMPVGTVILSSRAPIGKVAIAGNTFYCNQGFKNIICKEGITPRYLYTVLLLNVEYLNSLGRGATFKEISKGIVESIRIPVPSMELQEQFAAFVEQTDKSKYYSSLSFRYCQAAANTYRQEWMTCRTSDF